MSDSTMKKLPELAGDKRDVVSVATQNNFGRDPYAIEPDAFGHRTRGSDSSSFDTVCVCCGRTDRIGCDNLMRACGSPLPAPSERTPRQILHDTLEANRKEVESWPDSLRNAISFDGALYLPPPTQEAKR